MKRHMMGEDAKSSPMMNMLKAQGRTKEAPKPLMNQMGPGLQMPDDKQMTSAKSKAQYTKAPGAKGKMKNTDVAVAHGGKGTKGPGMPMKMVTPGAKKMHAKHKKGMK